MTTGPIFTVQFMWEIKAHNGMDDMMHRCTRYEVTQVITADMPEHALAKFRDWWTRERNNKVIEFQERDPTAAKDLEHPDTIHFNRMFPQKLVVTSIKQKGTVIT